MLSQRILVVVLLLPLGIAAIIAGGLWFLALSLLILSLAAWEYVSLFRSGGLQPAGHLVLLGVIGLLFARYTAFFDFDLWLLPLFSMLAMAFHLFQFERGRDQAGTDFAVTLSAFFYVGLLGAFMLSIRMLPGGTWWLLLTLIAVWIADSAAFFLGTRFGRHKLAPRLSPKKSWQGYLSGIVLATLLTPLLLGPFQGLGMPVNLGIDLGQAALFGFLLGALPTLGDLGISMIKRQMAIKDSGTILPGHGGMLDRMDSWLWAFPISYFVITQFFLN